MFYADLHVHSKFSRATSRDCDLEHLAQAAARKGIAVVGTGDFTHPGWWQELSAKLVPAEPGLYRLRPELEQKALQDLPAAPPEPVRFLLQVEIATIYKKKGRTRKIHHLIYVPELEQARRFTDRLSRLGNVGSDGRPMLGLDSRNLLELVLQTGPGCYLVPAHVWTPWFSVFGAYSGFDLLEDCYDDLQGEIFALETGLSSDPPMNWRWSALDRYALVSNSDAHSPAKLGRECCVFDSAKDYFAIQEALRTGQGYAGTVEFFPEEGKYHLDGHRQCGICWEPDQTRQHGGRCPQCGRPVTLGVLHRVCALGDRPHPPEPLPAKAAPFRSLIPLCEILGEILQVGPDTKTVQTRYEALLARIGPELWILEHAPLDVLARHGSGLLAEAIRRMRSGQVFRQPGFDGQYGVIRLFTPEELQKEIKGTGLFLRDVGTPDQKSSGLQSTVNILEPEPPEPTLPESSEKIRSPRCSSPGQTQAGSEDIFSGLSESFPQPRGLFSGIEGRELSESSAARGLLATLDPDQRAAAECVEGPVLILAGPGTGKTRVLTHRMAYLVAEHGAEPEACLGITFSRRAAAEMRHRLHSLVPESADRIPVMTFHAFGWTLLREYAERVSAASSSEGQPSSASGSEQGQVASGSWIGSLRWRGVNGFPLRLASEPDRRQMLCELLNLSVSQADRLLSKISLHKRNPTSPPPSEPKLKQALRVYQEEMDRRGWLDFDDLVLLPRELLQSDSSWRSECQARYRFLSVDEFQDMDAVQYALLRVLVPPGGNLCVIGDPDQAIYGFRGADVGFFEQFLVDYPTARQFVLTRNYRSSRVIVEAAGQMIAPASLVPERKLLAQPGHAPQVEIHTCPTERAEAELVVHRIEQLLGGPTFFSLDSRRSEGQCSADLSFSDIAILYRTEAQAAPLVEALQRSGMPFQVCSHRLLTEDPVVQKVLSMLCRQPGSTAENPPQPEKHRTETPQTPPRRSPRQSVPGGSDSSGEQTVSRSGSASDSLAVRLRLVLEKFHQEEPTSRQEDPLPKLSPMVRAALERLAETWANDPTRFLTEIALTTVADLWDDRADRISLLTLHAAKGLEFPVVFIVGCEDGLIPLRFSAEEDPARLAEERRLLFVGMTRAQQYLILTHARRRHWQGKVRPRDPSPFLEEVQRELLRLEEHKGTPKARPSDYQRQLFD